MTDGLVRYISNLLEKMIFFSFENWKDQVTVLNLVYTLQIARQPEIQQHFHIKYEETSSSVFKH